MFTDEDLAEIVSAVESCAGIKTEAAKMLGVSADRVRRGMKRAAERGLTGFKPVMEGFRISQVTNTPSGDFIKQQPERGETFQVPDGHTVKGVSALIDPDGREIIKWVKTREEDAGNTVLLDTIKRQLSEASHYTPLPSPPSVVNRDLLAFYPIADAHLGAFAWGKETGNDYDLDIAERILKQCTGELISRSAPAETALILDLGDLFHGDNT